MSAVWSFPPFQRKMPKIFERWIEESPSPQPKSWIRPWLMPNNCNNYVTTSNLPERAHSASVAGGQCSFSVSDNAPVAATFGRTHFPHLFGEFPQPAPPRPRTRCLPTADHVLSEPMADPRAPHVPTSLPPSLPHSLPPPGTPLAIGVMGGGGWPPQNGLPLTEPGKFTNFF